MFKYTGKTSVIVGFLLLLIIGSGMNCQLNVDDQLSKQEIAIYEVLIAEKSKDMVLIDNSIIESIGFSSKGGLNDFLGKIKDETWANFFQALKSSPTIEEGVRLRFGNLIIDQSNAKKNDLITKGYFQFTRVGFSNDGKQAVVWFTDGRNLLGMSGGLYLLVQRNGVWEVEVKSIIVQSDKLMKTLIKNGRIVTAVDDSRSRM